MGRKTNIDKLLTLKSLLLAARDPNDDQKVHEARVAAVLLMDPERADKRSQAIELLTNPQPNPKTGKVAPVADRVSEAAFLLGFGKNVPNNVYNALHRWAEYLGEEPKYWDTHSRKKP